jgi:hypothetical protein
MICSRRGIYYQGNRVIRVRTAFHTCCTAKTGIRVLNSCVKHFVKHLAVAEERMMLVAMFSSQEFFIKVGLSITGAAHHTRSPYSGTCRRGGQMAHCIFIIYYYLLTLCLLFIYFQAHAAEEDKWRTAGNTLLKYIANVGSNPDEEKFRCVLLHLWVWFVDIVR